MLRTRTQDPVPGTRRLPGRTTFVCVILGALLVVLGIASITTGTTTLPLSTVLNTLTGNGTKASEYIVFTARMPRLITAVFVGAALGVSGAIFQSLSRNPLGSPDIIGFTAGAATGIVVVVLLLGGGLAQISAGALLGGLATAVLVYLLAFRRGVQGFRLILIGIGVSSILSSVNAYLITKASVTLAHAASIWLTGNLGFAGWGHVRTAGVLAAVLIVAAVAYAKHLAMLEMGDDSARALGVPVERSRMLLIAIGVGLAAVATAAAGLIAFVALAAPQLARRLTRSGNPGIVPSALVGAVLLTGSDLAGQQAIPGTVLPVGLVTGLTGGVYLVWLLAREWRSR